MIDIVKAEEKHISDIYKLWLEFLKSHAIIDSTIAPDDDFFALGKLLIDSGRVAISNDWGVLSH